MVGGAFYFYFFLFKKKEIIALFDGGWVVKLFFYLKKRIIMAIIDGGWVVNLFFTTEIPKYRSKIRQSIPQKMRVKFYVFIVCFRIL